MFCNIQYSIHYVLVFHNMWHWCPSWDCISLSFHQKLIHPQHCLIPSSPATNDDHECHNETFDASVNRGKCVHLSLNVHISFLFSCRSCQPIFLGRKENYITWATSCIASDRYCWKLFASFFRQEWSRTWKATTIDIDFIPMGLGRKVIQTLSHIPLEVGRKRSSTSSAATISVNNTRVVPLVLKIK